MRLHGSPGEDAGYSFRTFPRMHPLFQGTDVPVQRLVDYLEQMCNLYAFLEDHLHISARRALDGLREYVRAEILAHSERGRVSGTSGEHGLP